MARNFLATVPIADGESVVVHVNRRGCTGRWTKADDEALQAIVQAIVRAAVEIDRAKQAEPPAGDER